MAPIPRKISDRLTVSIKRFQSVLSSAKARDVNESDTVIIVTDMLSEVFGYDKYTDLSSEHAIRGTYCDLAISIEGKIQLLIEVKAVGTELKDSHVKQAVDYAANKGVDWVILTNGIHWRLYKVSFGKPIDQDLVLDIDALTLNLRNDEDLKSLYLLTKEGWQKEVMVDFVAQKQALSRFFIAALVLSDTILDVIRRELKRSCPDVKVKNEQIQTVLLQEVLKRDVVEGEKADEARKKMLKANARLLRSHETKDGDESDTNVPSVGPDQPVSSQPPAPSV